MGASRDYSALKMHLINNCYLYDHLSLAIWSELLLSTVAAAESVNDVHHEKTDLKVFIVVIPKEEWARAAILLLV